jgi:hypothetical protein
VISIAMWVLTLAACVRQVRSIELPKRAPRWCRPLVFGLSLGQPIVRGWHRFKHRLRAMRIPRIAVDDAADLRACTKSISWLKHDLYFTSNEGRGREHLLAALVERANEVQWCGDFSAEWEAHDVELYGDGWHDVRLRTATEELGGPDRYTRVRCSLCYTRRAGMFVGLIATWTALALVHQHVWPLVVSGALWAGFVGWMLVSRHRCRHAVSRLVYLVGRQAGLQPARLPSGPAPVSRAVRPVSSEPPTADPETEACLSP